MPTRRRDMFKHAWLATRSHWFRDRLVWPLISMAVGTMAFGLFEGLPEMREEWVKMVYFILVPALLYVAWRVWDAPFQLFHKVEAERDALLPRSLDGLKELLRRGRSKDWVEPQRFSFYPGGAAAWEREDDDWSSEVVRVLHPVAGQKYVRRFLAAEVDDSSTPLTSLVDTDEQHDRWRLRHVRVEELVKIIHELEEAE